MRSDDLVGDVAEAVATNRDVEWESCAQAATHGDHRRLENLRALSGIFAGVSVWRDDALPPAATRRGPRASAFLRWAVVVLIVVAGTESLAALLLLPGGWDDYYRAYGGLSVFLVVMLAGHGASACIAFYAGFSDRRMWRFASYCVLWTTFPAAHMLPILLWGIPQPGELPAVLHAYPFAFAPAFLWAFAGEFPQGERRTGLDDLVCRMVPVTALLGAALYTGFALVLYLASSPAAYAAAFFVSWDVVFASLNLLDLVAVAAVAMRARDAVNVEVERAWLFVGGFLIWVGWIVASDAIELLWPAPSVSSGLSIPVAVAGGMVRMLGLLMLWHAVLTRRAISARSVARTVYGLLLSPRVLGLAAALSLAGLGWLVASHPERSVGAALADPDALLLIAAVGIVLLGGLVRERLLVLLDAWTYPETREQRRALTDAKTALVQAGRIAEVQRVVARAVQRGCGAPATLLAPVAHAATPHALSAPDATVAPLARASAIVHVLETTRTALGVHPHDGTSVFEWLPDDEAAWVVATGAAVMVPILGPGADVIGVLLLGHRTDDPAIRPVDVPFLEALAVAAGVAVERLRLLEAPAAQQADAPPAYECPDCCCVTAGGEPLGCECGAAYVEAEVPRFLAGKFRLTRRLGTGGMGAVYLARDMVLDRDVAVKTLIGASVSGLGRLKQEARTMATVTHPAVAHIYGIESWRGRPFLIAEFLAGGTLADRLRRGPIPASLALAVSASLAEALMALNEAGYLHGDVKPSNIGFASNGSAKLLDFGLARLTHDGAAVAGGTLPYLSPEVLAGQAPDEVDDVWSLCVVLCEMVSGQHPFAAPGAGADDIRDHILRQRIHRGFVESAPNPGAEAALMAFAASVLTADRSARPVTARGFAEELYTAGRRG